MAKISLVKTRDPGLAPGWTRVRDWSIQALVAVRRVDSGSIYRYLTGQKYGHKRRKGSEPGAAT